MTVCYEQACKRSVPEQYRGDVDGCVMQAMNFFEGMILSRAMRWVMQVMSDGSSRLTRKVT